MFENYNYTEDSFSINIEKNLAKVDITSNSISDISNSFHFTIDNCVSVASDRKHEGQILKVLTINQALSSMKLSCIHTGVVQMELF